MNTIYSNNQNSSQQQLSKCTQDILLQGFAFLFFLSAGLYGSYGAKKQNVVLPFIAAPSASAALSKVITSTKQRQRLRKGLSK